MNSITSYLFILVGISWLHKIACAKNYTYAHVCLSHEDEHLQFFTNIAHKQWNVMIKFYL